MKRTKEDVVISDLVRLRANFICQARAVDDCHGVDTNAQITFKSTFMQCLHYNSRGAGNICRHDTDFLICGCSKCHGYLGGHPLDHTRLMERIVGDGLLERKRELHSKPYKWAVGEKAEMHKHYKSELARVRGLRMNGEQDYIETVSWW